MEKSKHSQRNLSVKETAYRPVGSQKTLRVIKNADEGRNIPGRDKRMQQEKWIMGTDAENMEWESGFNRSER